MESPPYGRDNAQTRYLMRSKTSSSRNGLYLVESFIGLKGSLELPQASQTIAKAVGCSSHPNGKTLLLRTLSIGTEHGKIQLVPN